MAVADRTATSDAGTGYGGIRAFVYETAWLGLRTLRRFYRVPANPVSIVLFPIIQLVVFSQLFRGIIVLPGFEGTDSYLAYLAPGQIVFTVFFAVAWSGGGLLMDYRAGYLDKLRATPANRYSIIGGELVTLFIESVIMSAVILAVTIVLGASVEGGIVGAILILLIAGAFGVAWAGTSMAPALLTKNEQATGTLAFLFIPVAFLSTAFVPEVMMPDWLRAVNVINPISYVIEALRSLMAEGIIVEDLIPAIVSIVLLGVALHSLTLWAFRRLTA
jgi:ABC-2 type transport system permease protein